MYCDTGNNRDRGDRYGFVNLDTLLETNPRLKRAQGIAGPQRFFHWELEFADLFATRGGFDLVLGNPPWIKVEWNEKGMLAEYSPLFALRKLSAKDAADGREEVFDATPKSRHDYPSSTNEPTLQYAPVFGSALSY